jgi:hypothetical protein
MGGHWRKFMEGFPSVPVHDLKIHPRDRELIAATHGRSIGVVDIAPLQELTDQVTSADVHLFKPKPGLQYGNRPIGGESTGHQVFQDRPPAYGAEIAYWIGPNADIPAPEGPPAMAQGQRPQGPPGGRMPGRAGGPQTRGPQLQITILDADGNTVHTGTSAATPGIHRYHWDFRGQAAAEESQVKAEEQIQDSLQAVERVQELVDSLAEAGRDRAQLEQTRDMILSGNPQRMMGAFGGGGAAGGSQRDPDTWVERPGENFSAGGRGGGFTPEMRILFQAARPITGTGGFGRGGGGGQAPLADAGDNTVVLKAGDEELRQTLTVVKGPDDAGGGGSF